jgi:putative tryptophan/tyrosine transport system substrate-binding protein
MRSANGAAPRRLTCPAGPAFTLARLALMALGLLAAPLAADTQPAAKGARVGFLSPTSLSDPRTTRFLESFRQGLRELGWIEGQNIAIEPRWADGTFERLPGLAAELVQLKVDVIVAVVTQASLAAKHATQTIPIVMVGVGDPLGSGLVASLARPGGNVTGPSSMLAEVSGKQLALLKETIPRASPVAVLWNPANPVWQAAALRETEAAARALGLRLQLLEARGPDELEGAFAAMTRERAGALFVPADIIFARHAQRMADLAARNHLPAMYGFREHVEAGGLMSYAADFAVMFRRAAVYVDRILKGAKPADLPVEQPTKFELVINLKTAKALGVTIPPAVLARADEVIE